MRRRKQEMVQRERAYLHLQQQQQAAASSAQQHSSGNTHSHEQMNDLGNVNMVEEAGDDDSF